MQWRICVAAGTTHGSGGCDRNAVLTAEIFDVGDDAL